MSIRQARPDDWKSIGALLDQLEYPGSERFLESKISQMIEDPGERLLVFEEKGEILGFISLHFIPQIALEGDFARISYFAVERRARGGGIGRRMEEHCTRLAMEKGCQLIEVHCHTRRSQAHSFYFRQGYEESPKYLIKRLR
ncbi:GNAT family N-acetyltransferase [Flavitalea sp. BT771]|uniref:GNAT family N-acetyltransferase n=1 Tax=Flavitalea sp. BT771 TaxID=3063329 RepID=UPI0026E40E16|nr:GNAT family N-acetyltransferase [Flavitalea sp. BT771]MDO6435294.1 GNAT family N-acetyltransferase [Flavitalea sp. BT771]MDV6224346.1 GNAT family N-acetyltransferase [Flavitalea sp. BT771]